MGDRVTMLRAQLDVTWGLAEHHLERLTDAELLWEPGSPCWTVHRDDDGRWRPDWQVPEPDPVPTPSAAWVSWHLGWWWTTALAHLSGRSVPAREDVTWPGDAAATAVWLRGLHRDWLALLEATREPDLDALSTFPWPAEQGRTVADTLAWAGAELTKNVAEIGQLRLLHATRRARPGAPDPWGPVLDRAHEWAGRWLATLPTRPVAVPVDPARMRSLVADRLPERGQDPLEVLADLGAALEPGLVAGGGPRYFGFVTGGALPVALAADWMTAAADQNAATYVMSPAAATVEEVTGRWVLELLGLPADAAVGFVTGAQGANITCLAAARRALLARVGHDVDAAGLAGGPAIDVVVGEQAHATVLQALRLLGLGADRALRVDADVDGRMRPERLREQLAGLVGPVLVCAQAGQVDTGVCDPLDAVAAVVAERDDAWLHVDGAFGLWAAAAPGRRHLVAGAGRADSWAVDAHKWLNVPYDCAMAIVRDRGALTGAMTTSAAYLPLGDLDPSSRTPESSRRARAVPVHAALRALGRDGVADLVERCCLLARRAGDALARHPRLEVLGTVELNQVAFRPLDVDAGALAAAVQRDGTCWVGTTVRQGRPALRFSVSNWSTTAADIDRSVDRITTILERDLEPPGCDRVRPDPGGQS